MLTGLGYSTDKKFYIAQNKLLQLFPDQFHEDLMSRLEVVFLSSGKMLYDAGDVNHKYIYFPLKGCIVSMCLPTVNGQLTEVAAVGSEGLVGVGAFLANHAPLYVAMAQCEGPALLCKRDNIIDFFNSNLEFRKIVLQFAQYYFGQISQNAVCFKHHTIEQQFCKWLLFRIDRLPGATIKLTHEFIAKALGVRREGISEAVSTLQSSGYIQSMRGQLKILDAEGLKEKSCDCYRDIISNYAKVMRCGF